MTKRPVQLSLVDGMERAVGPLPLSVQTGSNADLVFAIAPIYLTGSVLDVTFGRGRWWTRFTPDPFVAHDLHTVDGVDFRALPESDRSFDAVVFDPPYVAQGGQGTKTKGCAEFRDRFGLDTGLSTAELRQNMEDGLAECVRVSRRWVLVKCADFVDGGKFRTGSLWMMDAARALGCVVQDVVVHFAGTGPGGHNIREAIRCRRAHSYLLVFEVPREESP